MKKTTTTLLFLVICVICLNMSNTIMYLKVDQWFDSYGVIPWEEEMLHLDNFAVFLKRNPEMNGYIAFYVGEKDSSDDIENRIKRAKNYLICDLKIKESRIFIVKAGKREETKIILQPVSNSKPAPDF